MSTKAKKAPLKIISGGVVETKKEEQELDPLATREAVLLELDRAEVWQDFGWAMNVLCKTYLSYYEGYDIAEIKSALMLMRDMHVKTKDSTLHSPILHSVTKNMLSDNCPLVTKMRELVELPARDRQRFIDRERKNMIKATSDISDIDGNV
tara:strand:+ start:4002 stop:4454 length:453 start_codon:yes stop_codon:yes gene_type:complete